MKLFVVLAVVSACGSNPVPKQQPVAPRVQPVQQPEAAPAPEASPPSPESTRVVSVESIAVVRFVRNTVLRATPDVSAPDIGAIARNARAAVVAEAPGGAGCATRWIQISPRGWACDTATTPTNQLPSSAPPSSLTSEDPTPPVRGVYGYVRKNASAFDSVAAIAAGESRELEGKNSVRAVGAVTIEGKRYWRTSGGELIDAKSIVGMAPSRFRGVVVEDPARMPAWVRSAGGPSAGRAQPNLRARVVRMLASRTVVEVRATSDDDRFVDIGDGVWVAKRDLRIAQQASPPDGVGDDEKWFDIDLDQQVLVAYQGSRPVYATLVSTGRYDHKTPTVITRIAHKLAHTTMSSNRTDVYSVADVPWTMFYDRDYALHTAYWHDGFGSPRSHGCVNLAPYDARLLFRWSSPDVPPGWIAVRGSIDNPGSLVRVRSRYAPNPQYRGYAREIRELAVQRSLTQPTELATR